MREESSHSHRTRAAPDPSLSRDAQQQPQAPYARALQTTQLRTTMAVVTGIFAVIVIDAFFAVFFTEIGWG